MWSFTKYALYVVSVAFQDLTSCDLASTFLFLLCILGWVPQKFKWKPSFTCWVSVRFNRVTKLPSRNFFLYQSSFLSTDWKENWKKRKRQWDPEESTWLVKAYRLNITYGKEDRTTLCYASLFHSSGEVAFSFSIKMELDSILKCYSLGKRRLGWWGKVMEGRGRTSDRKGRERKKRHKG